MRLPYRHLDDLGGSGSHITIIPISCWRNFDTTSGSSSRWEAAAASFLALTAATAAAMIEFGVRGADAAAVVFILAYRRRRCRRYRRYSRICSRNGLSIMGAQHGRITRRQSTQKRWCSAVLSLYATDTPPGQVALGYVSCLPRIRGPRWVQSLSLAVCSRMVSLDHG